MTCENGATTTQTVFPARTNPWFHALLLGVRTSEALEGGAGLSRGSPWCRDAASSGANGEPWVARYFSRGVAGSVVHHAPDGVLSTRSRRLTLPLRAASTIAGDVLDPVLVDDEVRAPGEEPDSKTRPRTRA